MRYQTVTFHFPTGGVHTPYGNKGERKWCWTRMSRWMGAFQSSRCSDSFLLNLHSALEYIYKLMGHITYHILRR